MEADATVFFMKGDAFRLELSRRHKEGVLWEWVRAAVTAVFLRLSSPHFSFYFLLYGPLFEVVWFCGFWIEVKTRWVARSFNGKVFDKQGRVTPSFFSFSSLKCLGSHDGRRVCERKSHQLLCIFLHFEKNRGRK